jgi:hypothetical protein
MGELVYEMVWDCRYCGARKLLGLTHRHCPNCGAQQDPNARYFPPEDEKVAVQNHEFVGADMQCRYCGGASSRRAHNCGQCGAPLAEGAAVQPREAASPERLAGAGAPAAPRRSRWKLGLGVFGLLLLCLVATLLFWKKGGDFTVASCQWRRTVALEQLAPTRASAWCSELPAGARNVSRHQQRHGSKRVPDGEQCHVEKKDRGDGTYKEEQVCVPKFKDEPVYDEMCDYLVLKWSQLRQEVADGASSTDAPRWPVVELARPACGEAGCQREGARSERYSVVFADGEGSRHRCDVSQNAWASFAVGQRYSGQLRALTSALDCGSLRLAR